LICTFALLPNLFLLSSTQVRAGDEIEAGTQNLIVKEIIDCLHQRGEFHVNSQDARTRCTTPHEAPKTKIDPPFSLSWDDIDKICRVGDYRALSGDVIKRIVAQSNNSIGPMGIRLIGGVYCDQIDLAGLDLQYSLILDKAVFKRGIAARNLRVKGDFSIDDSLVAGTFTLNRARIDGSFYHGNGFIEREIITDTKIEGTWHQSGTVILDNARFQNVAITGDLDISESALNRFSLDGSSIAGGVILNDSEARCSYDIRTSNIGLVLAERAGFGTGTTRGSGSDSDKDSTAAPEVYSWWLKLWPGPNAGTGTDSQRRVRELLTSPAVRGFVSKAQRKCEDDEMGSSARIRFAVLETHIRTNMCLRSFNWLRWPVSEYEAKVQPISALILNGTGVDVGLIVTFNDDQFAKGISDSIRDRRLLEAKGLTAGSLIFEFSEAKSSYATQLDGLKFGRIHSNLANCVFKSEQGGVTASGSSERPRPPSVEQVVSWLTRNKNPASSTQPFTAFADAFESIGEDATSLKVARASQELWDKTVDWFRTPPFPVGWSVQSFRATFIDSIPIAFNWGLRIVADHGYRPGKAAYGVLITLMAFWLIFWFRLQIVAFEPEKKESGDSVKSASDHTGDAPSLLPVGFLFLFDRLVPAFEIREENYSIGMVYGRASPFFKWFSKTDPPADSGISQTRELRYLSIKHVLVPLGDREKDLFKKWLIALRVIGVAWGAFLLAALNALVKH
jgi:hypothetical protein